MLSLSCNNWQLAFCENEYSVNLMLKDSNLANVEQSVEELLHKAFKPQRSLKLVLIMPKLASCEIKHSNQIYSIPYPSHLEIINCVFNKDPKLTKVEIFSDNDVTVKDGEDTFTSKTIWLNPQELINKFERIDFYDLVD